MAQGDFVVRRGGLTILREGAGGLEQYFACGGSTHYVPADRKDAVLALQQAHAASDDLLEEAMDPFVQECLKIGVAAAIHAKPELKGNLEELSKLLDNGEEKRKRRGK